MTSPIDPNKILVVDDSLTIRMKIKEIFEAHGYGVLMAENGRQCLELLETERPDIILLDVMMPALDGIEVCRLIKADARLKDIPVVILTSLKTTDEKIRGFQTGAEDYLVKPFVEEELRARVATHLETGNVMRQLKVEMAERRQAQADLKKTYDELEMRVKERTCELEKTNETLQKEIEQRRQAQDRQKLAARILELLNRPTGKTDAIRDILGLIHQYIGFEAVGIRLQEGEDFPYYRTTGFPRHFLDAETSLCARDRDGALLRDSNGNPILECMCGNIIRGKTDPQKPFFTESGSFWTNSTTDLLSATSEKDRQSRTRNRCNIEGYESVALIPLHSGDKTIGLLQLNDHRKGMFTSEMIGYFEGISASIGISIERKQAEEELQGHRDQLEKLVKERTWELEASNKELEAFAYSVSHDLRAPLRHIDGFLELLIEKSAAALDEQSRHYMEIISDSANKMGLLIEDLLSFSRMGRQTMAYQQVNLRALVRNVIRELEPDAAGRTIDWRIGDLPVVGGDAAMLKMAMANLIANAIKFTRPREKAMIEIGPQPNQKAEAVIFVRDNGVGFDMAYADKLFGVFQRLHRADEFEGTGIGLANVRRIISRHGGRVWAKGELNQGAAFYLSLPYAIRGAKNGAS